MSLICELPSPVFCLATYQFGSANVKGKRLWTAPRQSLSKHVAEEDVPVLNRCGVANGNRQQLRQHCCFPSSVPFRTDGRSRKSLQLFLIKTRMMIEWGILKCSSSCPCNNGKHEGSVQRQDIIHLPKKNKKQKSC